MRIELTETPKGFAKQFEHLPEQIEALANQLHRSNVFYCLEAMVMWSRVDTGRMRASFTPFMDKYYHQYQRSMSPVSGKNAIKDPNGEAEGKSLGFFVDQPLYTQIGSNVAYIEPLDAKTGIFDVEGKESYRPAPFASLVGIVYKFQQFTQSNFDQFFEGNADKVLNFTDFLSAFKGMGVNGEIDLGMPEE